MAMANKQTSPKIFENGVHQAQEVKDEATRFKTLCQTSNYYEGRADKHLRRFVKAALITIRASKKLFPSFPTKEHFLEYLVEKLRDLILEVEAELDANQDIQD